VFDVQRDACTRSGYKTFDAKAKVKIDSIIGFILKYMNIKNKKIPIPKSSRTKAILFVDIQKGFIKKWNKPFLSNIATLCAQETYDLYVDITFHAEKESLWDKQTNWTFPYEPSVPEITEILKNIESKKVVHIIKETRSAFKGDKDLKKLLLQKGIEEVHVVGFDSNDCVFATAQESFDFGFYTYVIEECTGASNGERMHKYGIEIMRNLRLTNHSAK